MLSYKLFGKKIVWIEISLRRLHSVFKYNTHSNIHSIYSIIFDSTNNIAPELCIEKCFSLLQACVVCKIRCFLDRCLRTVSQTPSPAKVEENILALGYWLLQSVKNKTISINSAEALLYKYSTYFFRKCFFYEIA